jgi:acyl-homoserine-lactone acylase
LLGPRGYDINYGTSYVQVVTFDERGPVAQGLLTYGQSSDPASPRAYDQLSMFAAKRWLPLPFHREDVAAQREGAPLRLAYQRIAVARTAINTAAPQDRSTTFDGSR